MENASKALIIAGAILLALLLIGLGLMVFGMFDQEGTADAMDAQSRQMFNQPWENWAIRPQRAAQIRQLANNVNSHNAASDRTITLTGIATQGADGRYTVSPSGHGHYDVVPGYNTHGVIYTLEIRAVGTGSGD